MKLITLCIVLGTFSIPFTARSDESTLFVRALESCVSFYETLNPEAFSEWITARKDKAACSSCTTRSGRYEDPKTGAYIEVNHTFEGPNVGVDCHFRINEKLENVAPVEAWAKRGLESGRLQIIREPRFPNEKIRVCKRPTRPLAINIILRQQSARFESHSGKSTGGTRAPANCE